MDYSVTLETQGLGQLQLLLGTMERKLGDLTPLMDKIGSRLVESAVARFSSQTGPDGKRWKPSKRAEAGKAFGLQTLVEHGWLRDSIVKLATSNTVQVGTNKVYAASHQFGRDKPEKIGLHNRLIHEAFGKPLAAPKTVSVREHMRNPNLPARPFLGVDAEDVHELQALTYEFLAPNMTAFAA